ncbi:MAG: AAA family ATPase [Eubacteriaceae bacterium]
MIKKIVDLLGFDHSRKMEGFEKNTSTEHLCEITKSGGAKKRLATLAPNLLKAVLLERAGNLRYWYDEKNLILLSEYQVEEEIQLLKIKENKIYGGVFNSSKPSELVKSYDLDKHHGIGILGCLIPYLKKESNDFRENYEILANYYTKPEPGILVPEKIKKAAFILSDAIYREMLNNELLKGIDFTEVLNDLRILFSNKKEEMNPFGSINEISILCNEEYFLQVEKEYNKSRGIRTIATEDEMKPFRERELREEEKKLVPKLTNFEKTQNSEMLIKAIANGLRFAILFGPAGTGKSYMAQHCAETFGLPYLNFSMRSDTEGNDLLGSFIPETDVEKKDFKFVESQIILAAKNGYVLEIAEGNLSQCLTSINDLLDTSKKETRLENGEIIKAHENFIVIMTMNESYEGTKRINESLMDRFPLKIFINDLTEEESYKRIKKNGTCLPDKIIKNMCNINKKIKDYIKNNGIEGTSGFRALYSWVKLTEIIGCSREAAKHTILTAATMEEEIMEDLFINIIETSLIEMPPISERI